MAAARLAAAQSVAQTSTPDIAVMKGEIARLRQSIEQQQVDLRALEGRLDGKLEAPQPSPAVAEATADRGPEPPVSGPLEISGYFSSRFSRLPDADGSNYEQQTLSLFLDRAFGHLVLHSELEYEYGPELTPSSRPAGPASGHFGAETAWLDYKYRDSLSGRAGIFLTPTYWSLHHYPSTALTVENPLIHEKIFPTNVIGVMAHGSRYFEEGGFEYSLYAGKGANYLQPSDVPQDGRGALGGTFRVHVPSARLFRTFDAGVQVYRDKPGLGLRQSIIGFESRVERGPFEFIGELAHATLRSSLGQKLLFREGYYLQPSWRVGKGSHLYYRYDWLKFDSTDSLRPFTDENTVGINFRPTPTLSLKLEWNVSRSAGQLAAAREGFGAGVAFFFQ